jgi:hypothetical protein
MGGVDPLSLLCLYRLSKQPRVSHGTLRQINKETVTGINLLLVICGVKCGVVVHSAHATALSFLFLKNYYSSWQCYHSHPAPWYYMAGGTVLAYVYLLIERAFFGGRTLPLWCD